MDSYLDGEELKSVTGLQPYGSQELNARIDVQVGWISNTHTCSLLKCTRFQRTACPVANCHA